MSPQHTLDAHAAADALNRARATVILVNLDVMGFLQWKGSGRRDHKACRMGGGRMGRKHATVNQNGLTVTGMAVCAQAHGDVWATRVFTASVDRSRSRPRRVQDKQQGNGDGEHAGHGCNLPQTGRWKWRASRWSRDSTPGPRTIRPSNTAAQVPWVA